MVIAGTIDGADGSFARVNAVGETYEEAKAALGAMVPEGTLSKTRCAGTGRVAQVGTVRAVLVGSDQVDTSTTG
ncbi:hypothetical protein ACVWY0_001687 [Arthrobacter sp. UYNi723]